MRAATLEPARFFGREHELGTIATGKFADLVLLDSDPLADISNTKSIDAVVANGRHLPAARLRQMLADVESRSR